MDDKRASTLEAVEKFIQSQKLLLEQAEKDIARMRELRSYVLLKRDVDPEDLLNQIHAVGEIHDASHYQLVIPKDIDWDVFNGCDPAPMHALTMSIQEKQAERAKPSATQTSPLSDLQILVKECKKTIIDPALERCAAYMAQQLPPDDDDEVEDERQGDKHHHHHQRSRDCWKIEMERERAKEEIRELKKRKIHAGLSLPGMGSAAVFVRRDVEDESAEVDVLVPDDDDDVKAAQVCGVKEEGEEGEVMDIDIVDAVAPPCELRMKKQKKMRPARTRRATAKQRQWDEEEEEEALTTRRRRQQSTSTGVPTPKPVPPPVEDIVDFLPMDVDDAESKPPLNGNGSGTTNGKRARGNPTKPRSETYKQSWSESEQNLLEQLLEKIPDGEKNRWQKISRAMNGRRTPRQVASRVQKYFEKLKKFGIDINITNAAHGKSSGQAG